MRWSRIKAFKRYLYYRYVIISKHRRRKNYYNFYPNNKNALFQFCISPISITSIYPMSRRQVSGFASKLSPIAKSAVWHVAQQYFTAILKYPFVREGGWKYMNLLKYIFNTKIDFLEKKIIRFWPNTLKCL
jgi:hypothetical protein